MATSLSPYNCYFLCRTINFVILQHTIFLSFLAREVWGQWLFGAFRKRKSDGWLQHADFRNLAFFWSTILQRWSNHTGLPIWNCIFPRPAHSGMLRALVKVVLQQEKLDEKNFYLEGVCFVFHRIGVCRLSCFWGWVSSRSENLHSGVVPIVKEVLLFGTD